MLYVFGSMIFVAMATRQVILRSILSFNHIKQEEQEYDNMDPLYQFTNIAKIDDKKPKIAFVKNLGGETRTQG